MSATEQAEAAEAGTEVDTRQHEQLVFAGLEEAANLPPGSLSLVGLLLTDPEMRYEDWEGLGRSLGDAHRWTSWAIGDWLLFGQSLYGEEHSQAVEPSRSDRLDVVHRVTGLDPATLANYASICGRIPHSVRRVELKFNVHAAVQALERPDQIYWLQQAVDNAWSREELRQAIRDSKRPQPADGEESRSEVLDPPLSIRERQENAWAIAVAQAQSTSDGSVLIPAEPWRQVLEAMGEE